MTVQQLTTGDSGLDLVLGGGLATLARMPDLHESASVLIRGGPGAGKTLLGSQLAVMLAEQRGGDVAYACVELLPNELRAQLESVWGADGARGSRAVTRLMSNMVAHRFLVPPFASERSGAHTYVHAATLRLEAGDEQASMEAAIDELLDAIRASGGAPSVLVLDSLARGYHLANAPRDFADALVKLAVEEGLVLILLEESGGGDLTEWAYAMDVVLELEHLDHTSSAAAQLERRLWATKNRFGPSTPGPHRFSILENDGIRVFPSEVTYATPWARRARRDWEAVRHPPRWGIVEIDVAAERQGWLPTENAVVFVRGADTDLVRAAARLLLARPGSDLWLDLGHRADAGKLPTEKEADIVVGFGNPMLSPQRLLSSTVDALDHLAREKRAIGRVLVGDLAALDLFVNPDDLRRALAILLTVLGDSNLPTVLFETTDLMPARLNQARDPVPVASTGGRPKLLDWADAVADISRVEEDLGGGSILQFTHRASARSGYVPFDRATVSAYRAKPQP